MKARVLLLDDDDSGRFTLAALLEDQGFEVVEAGALTEAREALANGPFEVALIDVHLGDERGADIVPEFLATNPNASVAFLSGDPPPGGNPGHVWLTKGSDPMQTIARVGELATLAVTRSERKS